MERKATSRNYLIYFCSIVFQVARKAEALQLQRQSHIRFDESEDEEHT